MISEIQNIFGFISDLVFFDEPFISFDQDSGILRHLEVEYIKRTGLIP
jgi:hypothetical protein